MQRKFKHNKDGPVARRSGHVSCLGEAITERQKPVLAAPVPERLTMVIERLRRAEQARQ